MWSRNKANKVISGKLQIVWFENRLTQIYQMWENLSHFCEGPPVTMNTYDMDSVRASFTAHCDRLLNTLRPRQNGHHFADDDIFNYIFLYENHWIWFQFHWNLFQSVQLATSKH